MGTGTATEFDARPAGVRERRLTLACETLVHAGCVRVRSLAKSPPPALAGAILALLLAACGGSDGSSLSAGRANKTPTGNRSESTRQSRPPLPDRGNVYAAAGAGMLAPAVRGVPERVYVPNSLSNTVSVIDPHTFKVTATFPVGALPQHVTPS